MPNREPTMTNAHQTAKISDAPQAKRAVRPLLWLLLVISSAANVVTKSMDISELVWIGSGLVALFCGIALAVDHYRRRRR
jgi:hypothetical protein